MALDFPYHRQSKDYTCGPACMRMALSVFGIEKSEKTLSRLLHTNKTRGTWPKQMVNIAKVLKMDTIVKEDASIKDIKNLLKKDYVIIVCYFYTEEDFDHYSVVKKIAGKSIYFFDPWFGKDHKYTLEHFKKVWKTDIRFEDKKHWLLAVKK